MAGTLAGVLAGTMVTTGATAAAASHCHVTRTAHHWPLLHTGSRSSAVRYVQCRLHVRPRTGYFGPVTRAAVRRFQRHHHMHVTGRVSHTTWRKLGVHHRHGHRHGHRHNVLGRRVVHRAAGLKGHPYRWGGTGPRAFDCSGYTRYVYRTSIHRHLPRTSRQQYGRARRVSRGSARRGDLVFFHGRHGVYHVGILAGHDRLWHAPRPGRRVGREHIWTKKVTFGRVR